MKFTKFIPLALAAMLSLPVSAAATDTATQVMQLTFPDFINITGDGTQLTSGVTFNDDYTTINVTTALNAGFKVVSNYHSSTLTLTAAAPQSADALPAMYSIDGTSKLGFVFTNVSQPPANTSVSNITGGSATKTGNPNAIAYAFNAGSAYTPDSGASGTITPAYSANAVTYKIGNGIFNFDYDMADTTTPIANTFSTLDESGTYQCTLTLTRTGA